MHSAYIGVLRVQKWYKKTAHAMRMKTLNFNKGRAEAGSVS